MNTRWRGNDLKSNGENIIDDPKIKQLINGAINATSIVSKIALSDITATTTSCFIVNLPV